MTRIILLVFILIITSTSLLSNELRDEVPDYFRLEDKTHDFSLINKYYHTPRYLSTTDSEIDRRNYDVLEYMLEVDLTQALSSELSDPVEIKEYFSGSNTLRLEVLENNPSIEIDAVNLNIESIRNVSNQSEVEFSHFDGIISIDLNGYDKGDEVELKIDYNGISYDDIGFQIYHEGFSIGDEIESTGDPIVVEHNIAYTMSEPELARFWMPCNDRPYDKALSSIKIKVPEGYTATSNGTLQSNENNIWYWKSNYPITTYLMVINASIYDKYEQTYIDENDVTDTIPMPHYFWPEDRDHYFFKGERSMRNHPAMMQYFEDIIGDYRYDKYGTSAVYPYQYGGMEHQSMSTVHRWWLRDRGDDGFAHELAHHWWGNLITCATWKDLWINEGGATWSETLWALNVGGESRYKNYVLRDIDIYMFWSARNNFDTPPIYGLPISQLFSGFGFLVYDKAAVFNHMLSELVGREEALRAWREIFDKYEHTSIETFQIRDEFASKFPDAKIDINTFFDQWIYHGGHPVYTINSSLVNQGEFGNVFRVTLEQVQDLVNPSQHLPELFEMPVRLRFYKDNEIEQTIEVLNRERKESFDIILNFIPDKVDIDPMSVLHQIEESIVLNVESESQVKETSLTPNINSGERPSILSLNLNENRSEVNISLFNSLGNNIKEIYAGYLEQGNQSFNIYATDLPNGIYYLSISVNGISTTKKLIVNK